jgi:hypothetical protein
MRLGPAAWVVVGIAAAGQFLVIRRHHDLGWDLKPLYLAGKAVLSGRPIYDVPGFVYPPPAALLGTLLAWAPMDLWAQLDLALELAVLVLLAVVTTGWLVPTTGWLVPGRRRSVVAAAASTLLVWSHPAVHGLWLGNVSVVLAGVGLTAVVAFARGRWLFGCLVLGLSLLVKLPLVLIPLLARRVRPLLVAGAVSALVLLVSCLFTTGLDRLPDVVRKLAGGSVLIGSKSANNLSLVGFGTAHHLPATVVLAARIAVLVAVAAVVVVAAVRGRALAEAPVLACLSSTLLLGLLLAGSLSEVHYLFAVLPGGVAALAVSRSAWVRSTVAAGVLITLLPLRHASPIVHQELLVAAEVAFLAACVLAFLLSGTGRSSAGEGQGDVPPAAGADTATTASPS